MLTAVIRASSSAGPLAATLSVLIPAVAGGLIGHAVVIAPDADGDIARLAEATGADLVTAGQTGWSQGAAQARTGWLVLLDAGDLPEPGWVQAVERHLIATPGQPALMPLAGMAGLRERAVVSFGSRRLRAGLIAPQPVVLAGRLDKAPRRLAPRRERAAS